jgi:hypothetical protein
MCGQPVVAELDAHTLAPEPETKCSKYSANEKGLYKHAPIFKNHFEHFSPPSENCVTPFLL